MDTSSADRWFSALDQRLIGIGANAWVAQVLGVHGERDGLWIQLAPVNDPFATVVLHLASTTSIEDALVALDRHSRPIDGGQAIIDLATPASLDLRGAATYWKNEAPADRLSSTALANQRLH